MRPRGACAAAPRAQGGSQHCNAGAASLRTGTHARAFTCVIPGGLRFDKRMALHLSTTRVKGGRNSLPSLPLLRALSGNSPTTPLVPRMNPTSGHPLHPILRSSSLPTVFPSTWGWLREVGRDSTPTCICTWQNGETGLFWAAKSGHKAVVRMLLKHRAEVNAAMQVPGVHARARSAAHVISTRLQSCTI